MGEVEFFDKIKKINRILTSEARDEIWEFILNGLFVSWKALLDETEKLSWKDFGLEKGEANG